MPASNTVTLNTNFNVHPYYDDFDESKNYHRILFRPGLAVQARELTQMQTILQNQIDRFAEHVFKEGSIVTGCQLLFDRAVFYVKLRDNSTSGTSVNVASFLNNTIVGQTSGVSASVLLTNSGSEANTPNYKSLFVKYTGSNGANRTLANGEIITTTSGLSANLITDAATGMTTLIKVSPGIIFAKDHFIRVEEQSLLLSKYSSNATYRVGFEVFEEIINENNDPSLLDPASGAYNYAAPGAERLRLTPRLVKRDVYEPSTNNFIELAFVKNGLVQTRFDKPEYNKIKDYMAERTYDESGNYIVRGLQPRVREHLLSGDNQGVYTSDEGGSASRLIIEVSPGKAYIMGYDKEYLVSQKVTISKATDYNSVEQVSTTADYGNYITVSNMSGQWDINGQSRVTLRDTKMNSITNGVYSTTSLAGSIIGYARVRAIEYSSGTPGLSSCQYKMYLTDIQMSDNRSFTEVKSVGYDTTVADGKADIVGADGTNASTTDPSFDIGVFPLPVTAVKTIRATDNTVDTNFSFKKLFDIAFSTGSGSQATLSTGSASETLSGSGTISDDATRTRFYVVSRGSSNTTNLTGTVTITSGSTAVTGSGTAFTTQLSPGDIIACSPTQKFIVSSITDATNLVLTANAASSTGGAFHKRFLEGQVIDFANKGGGGDRSIAISSSTQATFNLNENLNTALNATVITELNKVDGQESEKVIARNRLVQLSLSSDLVGPWVLGLSDGFRIVSVRKKSGSNFTSTSEGTDVTNDFTLDSGMRDTIYEHARLVKKSTSSLTLSSGDRLLVKIDHFTHSYSTGTGYFSVDSYPVDDETAGTDTTKIYTYEIPVYFSPKTGNRYDLRDCIDIRPRMTDTAASVTTLTGITTNPTLSTSLDLPTGGLLHAAPGENFTMDLDYYLKRNDRIVLDKTGNFRAIRGTPSLNPITPDEPNGTMSIATINLKPYPSLPDEQGRRVSRTDLSNSIYPIKNPRFTMKDIGVLRDRIESLEYYTSLNLLEQNTKSLTIKDASGNDRFKNGLIVDQFAGHNIGDVRNPDYNISIDQTTGEARPPFKMDNFELFYNAANSVNVVRTNVTENGVSRDQTLFISGSSSFANGELLNAGDNAARLRFQVGNKLYIEDASGNFSSGTSVRGTFSSATAPITGVQKQVPGDLITMIYSHRPFITQKYASSTRNAAGLFWKWVGNVILDPDNDYWTDTVQLPDVQVNVNQFSDNWLNMPNGWGTSWNSWQTTWQGTSDKTDTRRQTSGGDSGTLTSVTTTTTSSEIRTGTAYDVVPRESTHSTGSRVVSSNIIPFMRSRLIRFTGKGLRPGSRIYAFFDSTAISNYVTPTDSNFNPIGSEGSSLTAVANGDVYGTFRLPNDSNLRFRVGTKVFRLTDSPTNSSTTGTVLSSAEGMYTAQGQSQQTQTTMVTTRYPEIVSRSVSETRTTSSSVVNSTFVPDPKPPPPPVYIEVPVEVPVPVVQIVKEVVEVEVPVYVQVTPPPPELPPPPQPPVVVTPPPPPPPPPPQPPPPEPEPPWWDSGGSSPSSDSGEGADGGDGGGDGGGDSGGGGDDPVAQSFLISSKSLGTTSSGIFVTKIDLFFATKHDTLGVEIHLREVDPVSYGITSRMVPFSRVVLMPDEVNISDDGSSPTPVYFPSPVYLQDGKEYAFIVKPIASNPDYNLFVSRLGERDILTGDRITTQPAAGTLFASSNDRQYSPVQEEDIKFTLYLATFLKSSSGRATFKNELRDYMTITNANGAFDRVGESVHGESILTGVFATTNTQPVNTGVTFVQGLTSGATGTISRFSPTQLRVRNITTTAKFVGGEIIRIRNLGANSQNPTSGRIIGVSNGAITSVTTPVGSVVYYNAVGFSNTLLHLANVSYVNSGPASTSGRVFFANTYIRGQTTGYNAYIAKMNSLRADVINFSTDYIHPANTGVAFYGKFATSSSTRDTTSLRLYPNDNYEFDAPRFVLSRSTESNTAASSSTMASDRSAEISIAMATQSAFVSPAIDVKRISVITVENMINANTTNEAGKASGGGAMAKYITRKVTLADGQDAEDIRVYVTSYRPPGSDVLVYYKVLHKEDSDTFDNSIWVPMSIINEEGATASTVYSSSEDQNDFKEYVYEIPDYGNTYRSGANTTNSDILEYRNSAGARFVGYKYMSIKVVLTNTTTTRPPRLDDLRVIALQR